MSELRSCILCGHDGREDEVRYGLIRWRGEDHYIAGPRCRDHDACFARVMAAREDWPVADGRPTRIIWEDEL